jgi:hypothetical protein
VLAGAVVAADRWQPTTNGMVCIAQGSSGLPNANGHIPMECATAAELRGGVVGYSTGWA